MSLEILHNWRNNSEDYRLIFDTLLEYSDKTGFDEFILCKLEVKKRFLGFSYWSVLKIEKMHEREAYKVGQYDLYPNEIKFDLINEAKENLGLKI